MFDLMYLDSRQYSDLATTPSMNQVMLMIFKQFLVSILILSIIAVW